MLNEYAAASAFITELFDLRAGEVGLSAEDRRLAMEMAYGVVRRKATLDALLRPHLTRGRHQVEPALWTLLRMGVYQLALMTAIPAHAAVHETVETARWLGKHRWTGFVNGVLRSVARDLTDDRLTEPAADAVPLTGGQYRRCARPVFADPRHGDVEYTAAAFSFPRWLIERWRRRFAADDVRRLAFWFNTPTPLTVRVNTLRTTRDALLAAWQSQGIAAEPGALPEAICLHSPTRIDHLPGFAEGWFAVQDEAAMQAAHRLAPQPGDQVLDLCAAPGTKTTHLAERMQNRGTVIACDISPARLALVAENARRLGLDIIESHLIREDLSDVPAGPFEAVLVDVPCSNTGVLGKRPDARWRLTPDDLHDLPPRQFQLLTTAADRTAPGGRVLYSTCSIEPEENADIIRRFVQGRSAWHLADEYDSLPGHPADGAYQALLVSR